MKKIGLLLLALVLALGTLGVGYAMWSDTLTITGNVNTGEVWVEFTSQYDNDNAGQDDPKEAGYWDGATAGNIQWHGLRYDKDVASTTSTYSETSAQILITNGYPSYWGSVVWDITNKGSIPVKLHSVTLVEISKAGSPVWTGTIALVIGTRYYVDVDGGGNIDETLDDGDDFSFILSQHWTEQIDPVGWSDAIDPHDGLAYLDVTVHVEQDAAEKTLHDFVIEYVFAQWNE